MSSMESAPRDGRYVAVSVGGDALAFAYYEKDGWVAPQMVDRPELGSSPIFPTFWVDIPVPDRTST